MRQKDYLVGVHEEGGVLVMHTLHWADEVRDPHRTPHNLPARSEGSAKERRMGARLIEAMATDWDPEDYRDVTHERVLELVEAKAGRGDGGEAREGAGVDQRGGPGVCAGAVRRPRPQRPEGARHAEA